MRAKPGHISLVEAPPQKLSSEELVRDWLVVEVPDVCRLYGGAQSGPELHISYLLWLAVDSDQFPPQVVSGSSQAPGHLQDVLRKYFDTENILTWKIF